MQTLYARWLTAKRNAANWQAIANSDGWDADWRAHAATKAKMERTVMRNLEFAMDTEEEKADD